MRLLNYIKAFFQHENSFKENTHEYTEPKAFVRTWSIVDFSKKNGKMQICKSPDKNNRESYLKCRFIDNKGTSTYVVVSSKLQNTTAEEISKDKDKIRIGQLPNNKYVLYDFR